MALMEIFGIGMACFLLLYLVSLLNDKEHMLLKALLIFFFMALFLLIPKTALDDEGCEIKLNETITTFSYANVTLGDTSEALPDSSNVTHMYSRVCLDSGNDTQTIFYGRTVWIFRIFMIYVFIYFVWTIYRHFMKKKNITWGNQK